MSGEQRGCKQAGRRDRCCILTGETSRNGAYACDPSPGRQGDENKGKKEEEAEEKEEKREVKRNVGQQVAARFSAIAMAAGRGRKRVRRNLVDARIDSKVKALRSEASDIG